MRTRKDDAKMEIFFINYEIIMTEIKKKTVFTLYIRNEKNYYIKPTEE